MRNTRPRPAPRSSTSTISMPAGLPARWAISAILAIISFLFVTDILECNKKVGFRPLGTIDTSIIHESVWGHLRKSGIGSLSASDPLNLAESRLCLFLQEID